MYTFKSRAFKQGYVDAFAHTYGSVFGNTPSGYDESRYFVLTYKLVEEDEVNTFSITPGPGATVDYVEGISQFYADLARDVNLLRQKGFRTIKFVV